jgi:ABC-type multidrug transport system fused ATPase/permease subunit
MFLNSQIFFKKILSYFSRKEKRFLFFIFFLLSIWTFAELLSIFFLGTFLRVATDQNYINQVSFINIIFKGLNFRNLEFFLIFLLFILIFIMIATSLLSIFANWMLTNFIRSVGLRLSNELFFYYLHQSRNYHLSNEKSLLIKKIYSDLEIVISQILFPLTILISRLFVTVFLFLFLFLLNPYLSGSLIIFFCLFYFLFFQIIKNKLVINSFNITFYQKEKFKLLNETFSGIREIILSNNYKKFYDKYFLVNKILNNSISQNVKISFLPKGVAELISIIIILIVFIFLLRIYNNNVSDIIPLLSMFALAGFKIIPSVQMIFHNVSTIKGSMASLESINTDLLQANKTVNDFNKELFENECHKFNFNKNIILKNVNFKYSKQRNRTLNNLNLEIKKNQFVGIYGKNGSGKSTVINLILGLIDLKDEEGHLLIDNKNLKKADLVSWQKNIGYVSQDIFLFDDTILENILFGIEHKNISLNRIDEVIHLANLEEFILGLPKKLDTKVGENGIFLSGGQKQKIAIARCLLKDPEVIILDEATSALDIESENNINQMLNKIIGKKTIIIVSHKKELLKKCNLIYYLKNGEVLDFGAYNKLLDNEIF